MSTGAGEGVVGTRGRASASGEGPAESARVQGGAAKVEAEAKAGGGGAECVGAGREVRGARVRGGRARVCNPIRRRGCPAILCTCVELAQLYVSR